MVNNTLNSKQGWNSFSLGDLVERVTRKNNVNSTKRNLTISAKLGLIDQEEYFTKTIASKDNSHYIKLLKGEFAYNKSYSSLAPIGATKRLDRYNEGAVSTLYLCFKIKNTDLIASDFLAFLVESSHWEKEISQIAVEGARNHGLLNVAPQDFFGIQIKLPPISEQLKIAEFLSALDERIELQERKVELLVEQKKGYVQRIFSRELRFRDDNGNQYPEWEEKTLGEVTKLFSGRNIPNSINGKFINVTMGSVTSSGGLIQGQRTNDGTLILKKGDLIMPTRDIGAGHVIGKTAVIPKENLYVAGNCVFALRTELNSIFLSYSINYASRPEMKRRIAGSAQLMIKISDVTSLPVAIPFLSEQEKIANFLSTLDEQISLEKEKLEQLKLQKQGYMQRIFA